MYKKGHIHFIGIGGIGMSGIAKILKYQGYTISGCDTSLNQKSIQELLTYGCTIYEGNNTHQCKDTSIDILVYSSAIDPEDEEIKASQARGIPTIPRALMLAEIMRTKYSIAISGAHGKTTTTSLISHIFIDALLDPTVIIGGHLKNICTNAKWGAGEFLVAEADESDRSFLKLLPTHAVVTNIDLEHLETYKDIDDIKAAFTQFLSNIPFYGKAIVCLEDPHIRSLLPALTHVKMIKYGLDNEADFFAQDIILEKDHSTFTVFRKNHPEPLGVLTIPMPGIHNVLNALAALSASMEVGISFEKCAEALKTFKGIERRFSFQGVFKGAEVIDDYAHHPTEISTTLQVALKKNPQNLIVVWQPHRYIRTEKLWDVFIHLFSTSTIGHLIITDIYAAGEQPINSITSARFTQELQAKSPSYPITYIPYEKNFTEIVTHLTTLASEGDLILLLGAGNINKIADFLKEQ
ncbi:UDP-N-acetylmuramate--L-alanine ligase [Candidatus Dependentiae bacterium]|nr:UDP-N-acetylmuramate--L-alanine ligase [Candidatus Dependentiae bacterium]